MRYNKNANDDNNNSNIDKAWDEAIEYLKQPGDSETAAKLAKRLASVDESFRNFKRFWRETKRVFQPIKDESRHFLCYALSMNRIDLSKNGSKSGRDGRERHIG